MIGAKLIAVFAMLRWLWELFYVVLGNLWYLFYTMPYLFAIEKRKKKTTQILEMIEAKLIAVFAMLLWLWRLFYVVVLGNLWYLFYTIPYLLVIEKGKKKTTRILEMIEAKHIVVFAMLPWLWGLFYVVVLGNLWYLFYLIPYLLVIEKGKKKTIPKGISVNMDDSTVLKRKDAWTSTDDIECVKNTNDEMIELNQNYCQDIAADTNPFLDMLENLDADGDTLEKNPFIIEDVRQIQPSGNPFLDTNDTASVPNIEDGNPALVSTNPFLQDCSYNQIVDISIFYPNRFGDVFTDITYAPTDSDIYCKEWIEQHRKCFKKPVRSFLIY